MNIDRASGSHSAPDANVSPKRTVRSARRSAASVHAFTDRARISGEMRDLNVVSDRPISLETVNAALTAHGLSPMELAPMYDRKIGMMHGLPGDEGHPTNPSTIYLLTNAHGLSSKHAAAVKETGALPEDPAPGALRLRFREGTRPKVDAFLTTLGAEHARATGGERKVLIAATADDRSPVLGMLRAGKVHPLDAAPATRALGTPPPVATKTPPAKHGATRPEPAEPRLGSAELAVPSTERLARGNRIPPAVDSNAPWRPDDLEGKIGRLLHARAGGKTQTIRAAHTDVASVLLGQLDRRPNAPEPPTLDAAQLKHAESYFMAYGRKDGVGMTSALHALAATLKK